ncbi:MAG: NAD-dependent epimerase/dehydratase family protein [Candidatus Taylorbacteria bacterium]|nr:NAD-dependent epimerase/dehydratase family protein [Candidatus Taylorbacteria bacterium]
MKILITGGAGFIGSHIGDFLVENGHEVVALDNLSSGKKENINPKAKLIEADVIDFQKIEGIFAEEKPEIIYHLAAQMDVRKSVEDPLFDSKTNILGSLNLLNLSVKYQIKKFIFSSTGGATYGDTDNRPTPETQMEWPLSPYGVAKLSVDKFLNYFHQIHGLNYVSLRYGNVYGPRQNPHGEAGVIAIFLNKMFKGEQPVINGEGVQTRDYVFVSDVAKANLLALHNFEKTGIFNVGTGVETNVNQLFQEINQHFENKFPEIHGEGKKGEQKTSCLNFDKIKQEFGWEPEINFKKGIKSTYQWFLERK